MEIKKDIWLLILFSASVGRYLNAAVTKKNEVYRVEKGKDKKGNVVYAPLICK